MNFDLNKIHLQVMTYNHLLNELLILYPNRAFKSNQPSAAVATTLSAKSRISPNSLMTADNPSECPRS